MAGDREPPRSTDSGEGHGQATLRLTRNHRGNGHGGNDRLHNPAGQGNIPACIAAGNLPERS